MGSFGDIARAACLNRKHDVSNMGGLDGVDGQMTDNGKDISLKPIHQCVCAWATCRLTTMPTIFWATFSKLLSAPR